MELIQERYERVVMGVELEAYTIQVPGYRISRRMAVPRRGVGEKGERFTRDASVGTEYNGPPFSTIREGLFKRIRLPRPTSTTRGSVGET